MRMRFLTPSRSLDSLPIERQILEAVITVALAIAAGMAVILLGDLSLKYRAAALLGILGTGFLLLSPDRRILSLMLWILIMPLSIEKVFYVAPPVWSGFVAQAITINAGDVLLALLFVFLLAKSQLTGEKAFYWPTVDSVAAHVFMGHRFLPGPCILSSGRTSKLLPLGAFEIAENTYFYRPDPLSNQKPGGRDSCDYRSDGDCIF